MDFVTNWVTSAATGVVNQGIAAAGNFAGEAVSGMGDLIASSGRQTSEGIAAVSNGWGNHIRSYGDGAIAATASDAPRGSSMAKTQYPAKKKDDGNKKTAQKTLPGAGERKAITSGPYVPPTKEKSFYDGNQKKTFPSKPTDDKKPNGAPKQSFNTSYANSGPGAGSKKVSISADSRPGARKTAGAKSAGPGAAKPAARDNKDPFGLMGAGAGDDKSKGAAKKAPGAANGAKKDTFGLLGGGSSAPSSRAPSVVGMPPSKAPGGNKAPSAIGQAPSKRPQGLAGPGVKKTAVKK